MVATLPSFIRFKPPPYVPIPIKVFNAKAYAVLDRNRMAVAPDECPCTAVSLPPSTSIFDVGLATPTPRLPPMVTVPASDAEVGAAK